MIFYILLITAQFSTPLPLDYVQCQITRVYGAKYTLHQGLGVIHTFPSMLEMVNIKGGIQKI